MSERPPPVLVETQEGLARLAGLLEAEPRFALDTEADSLHAYRERVCVVQLSWPGTDAIVDPLAVRDLSPLRRLVARPDVEVVMHGGDYDISILSREHDFHFVRVFDTMIAATLLGDAQLGLAALAMAAYGVHLSKKYQTADWKVRPFTPAHIEYLRNDTSYLLGLRDLLASRLVEADLVEEAEIEFRRLASRRGAPFVDDPEAWRKAKGTEKLDARARAVAARVWAWREAEARDHDVPRFRVLPNEAWLAMAAKPPEDLEGLRRVPGTQAAFRMGDAEALLGAVLAGVADEMAGAAPTAPEKPRRTPEERARLDAVREREERVRRWRNDEARRRNVPNLVVLPNPALEALSEDPPSHLEDLASFPDIGPKRAARYGQAILDALAGKRPPAPPPPPPVSDSEPAPR